MAKLFYDGDADLSLIEGHPIAIIGYGSQGHAHALNLKESGQDVRVGLHEGSRSRERAERAGIRVLSVAGAAREAQIIMILAPDTAQAAIYRDHIARKHAGADGKRDYSGRRCAAPAVRYASAR